MPGSQQKIELSGIRLEVADKKPDDQDDVPDQTIATEEDPYARHLFKVDMGKLKRAIEEVDLETVNADEIKKSNIWDP